MVNNWHDSRCFFCALIPHGMTRGSLFSSSSTAQYFCPGLQLQVQLNTTMGNTCNSTTQHKCCWWLAAALFLSCAKGNALAYTSTQWQLQCRAAVAHKFHSMRAVQEQVQNTTTTTTLSFTRDNTPAIGCLLLSWRYYQHTCCPAVPHRSNQHSGHIVHGSPAAAQQLCCIAAKLARHVCSGCKDAYPHPGPTTGFRVLPKPHTVCPAGLACDGTTPPTVTAELLLP